MAREVKIIHMYKVAIECRNKNSLKKKLVDSVVDSWSVITNTKYAIAKDECNNP